jgi:biopolymer transport protein ExbB/TolQ
MQTLTYALYAISNFLLLPVVVVLLVLLAWTLYLTGGFLRELGERKQVKAALLKSVAAASADRELEEVWQELGAARGGLPQRFLSLVPQRTTEARSLNRALSELEHDVAESIARHSFITRVGPMLGLMGTLIPLGPALTGLAEGNVKSLASNLVIAFTTTVVGLLVSGMAYGMALARRTWYARDLTDMEYLCEKLAERNAQP